MTDENRSLPREKFELVVSQPMELETLGTELNLFIQDLDGLHEMKTCYGDICKIVNALRDYGNMLRMVCEEWNLQGYHRAIYEFHADKLEEISKKFQAGIGYDYDKAIETCQRKRNRKQRNDYVGGEAMALAYMKAQRIAAKDNSAPADIQKQADVLMETGQVENYDYFEDDVIAFWVGISNAPQSIQTGARQIDGDRFDPNCLGVCVNYDFERRQFYIVTDTEGPSAHSSNVYYIDSAGDKHWFAAGLSRPFVEQLFLTCVQVVAHEDWKIKPTEQEALESVDLEMEEDFDNGTLWKE